MKGCQYKLNIMPLFDLLNWSYATSTVFAQEIFHRHRYRNIIQKWEKNIKHRRIGFFHFKMLYEFYKFSLYSGKNPLNQYCVCPLDRLTFNEWKKSKELAQILTSTTFFQISFS